MKRFIINPFASFSMPKVVVEMLRFVVLAVCSVGCNTHKDDDTPFVEPRNVSFAEYLLCDDVVDCNWTSIEEGTDAKIYIINSKEELGNYIFLHAGSYLSPCPFDVSIDFSKHTLLLTQFWVPGYWFYCTPEEYPKPAIPILLQQFSPNKYMLNIEMRLFKDNHNRQKNMAFIVDKLSKKSIVELDVTIQLEEENNWSIDHDETASIIGKWKLINVEISSYLMCLTSPVIIDFSPYDIVYEFKSNDILTVIGETGSFSEYAPVHQTGDHSYSFFDPEIGHASMDEIQLHMPRISSDQLMFSGWYYDGPFYYFLKVN